MLILALDTSAQVSAALHDGSTVLAEHHLLDTRQHAEALTPLMCQVFDSAGSQRAEVTHVVTGVGPGPFTGLRVAIATALTVGKALGVPVHGVCSLDAIAHRALAEDPHTPLFVTTDARRREVYWARYQGMDAADLPHRVEGPQVTQPAALSVADAERVVGRGALLYPSLNPRQHSIAPHLLDANAADLAATAALAITSGHPLLPPEPLYLRRPDAKEMSPNPGLSHA